MEITVEVTTNELIKLFEFLEKNGFAENNLYNHAYEIQEALFNDYIPLPVFIDDYRSDVTIKKENIGTVKRVLCKHGCSSDRINKTLISIGRLFNVDLSNMVQEVV